MRATSTEFDMLTQTQVQLLFVCTYSVLRMRIHTYSCRPFTMCEYFEGGIYWDELAETCSDISMVAGFRGAAGNTVSDRCFVTVHLVFHGWGLVVKLNTYLLCSLYLLIQIPQVCPSRQSQIVKKFCFWWSMTHRTTPTNITST